MVTFIGATGCAIILAFFILNETHIIDRDSVYYDLGNLIGALLLGTYAYLLGSTPFLVLNGVWALFSFKEVVSDLRKSNG